MEPMAEEVKKVTFNTQSSPLEELFFAYGRVMSDIFREQYFNDRLYPRVINNWICIFHNKYIWMNRVYKLTRVLQSR